MRGDSPRSEAAPAQAAVRYSDHFRRDQQRQFVDRFSIQHWYWTPVNDIHLDHPHWIVAIDIFGVLADRENCVVGPAEAKAFKTLWSHPCITPYLLVYIKEGDERSRARALSVQRQLSEYLRVPLAPQLTIPSQDAVFLHATTGPLWNFRQRNCGKAQALQRFRTNVLIDDNFGNIRESTSAGFVTIQVNSGGAEQKLFIEEYRELLPPGRAPSVIADEHVCKDFLAAARLVSLDVDRQALRVKADICWQKRSWNIGARLNEQRTVVPEEPRGSRQLTR